MRRLLSKVRLLPIGDAKGAALAFMVETMAVALTGASFAFEASSFFDDQGGPPNVGQFIIAIDPVAYSGSESFLDRMATAGAGLRRGSGRAASGIAPPGLP